MSLENNDVPATDGNILEVVDGEGQKPFLGNAEFEGQEDGEASEAAPSEPAEPVAPQDIDAPPAEPDVVDALAEAEKLLSDPEPVEPEDDFDDDLGLTDEDRDKPIGRAAKTIQGLRKRAQAAEAQVQDLRAKQDQFMVWADDVSRRYQFLEQRLQQGMQPQAPAEPAEPPLDPNDPDYAVKKFKQELRAERQADIDAAIAPYKQHIQKLEGNLRQRDKLAQSAQTSQRYNAAANNAAATMMSGFDQEVSQKLANPIGTLVLNAAYGWRTDVDSAGKVLDRLMTDYVLAKMRARQAATKAQVAQSQQAPQVVPQGRGAPNARGQTVPTQKEVEASGADDELDLMLARGGMIRQG